MTKTYKINEQSEVEVYGSVWFNTMDGDCIGIVTMNNGYEDKAYIGVPRKLGMDEDIQHILERGTPFPFEQAIKMTGGK